MLCYGSSSYTSLEPMSHAFFPSNSPNWHLPFIGVATAFIQLSLVTLGLQAVSDGVLVNDPSRRSSLPFVVPLRVPVARSKLLENGPVSSGFA